MAKSPTGRRRPPGPAPAESGASQVPAQGPHPLDRPDERKEGGPDFGKDAGQAEKHDRSAQDAASDPHPRLRRKPGRAP